MTPGATVLVDKAPEGEEPEVTLSVIQPTEAPAPKPVAVGATESATDGEEHADDVPPAPDAPPAPEPGE